MTTATLARKMPDGTICRTGPTCKRHGGRTAQVKVSSTVEKQLQLARQAVAEKIKALPLPAGSTRTSENLTNPDWCKPLYEMSRDLDEELDSSSQNVIRFYQMTGHRDINAYLRYDREGFNKSYAETHHKTVMPPERILDEAYDSAKRSVERLDEVFAHEKDLPEGTLLYRGVKIDDVIPEGKTALEYLSEKYQVGAVITDEGYGSTSADPDYMSFFGRKRVKAKGQHMVFEIVAKKGLPVFEERYGEDPHHPQDGNIQSFEREVLLNRNSKFRVVGVKNVTFKNAYPDSLRGWHSFVNDCPKKVTFPVIQLEQL